MQLTKHSDYAFRVLMYLAKQPAEQRVQIAQICAYYDISAHHVAKVVMHLVKLGWVTSVRGKGGGLHLQAAPTQIRLGDVVRAFEPTLALVNCHEPPCASRGECTLAGLLQQALQAFLAALDEYTLADVQRPPVTPTAALEAVLQWR